MNALRSFSVLAALSFAGAAYAQSTTVTHPTANPELDGASTASRSSEDTRLATASSSSRTVSDGMQVRSESGDLLGRVSTIIPGDAHNDAYVVVGDLQGLATLMPYATATAMTQEDKVVVDRAAFEKAPKLQKTQVEDTSLDGVERRSDNYWKKYALGSDDTGPTRR